MHYIEWARLQGQVKSQFKNLKKYFLCSLIPNTKNMTDLFIKYMRTILVIIYQFFVIDNSVFEHFEHSEDSNSYQGSIFDFFFTFLFK